MLPQIGAGLSVSLLLATFPDHTFLLSHGLGMRQYSPLGLISPSCLPLQMCDQSVWCAGEHVCGGTARRDGHH